MAKHLYIEYKGSTPPKVTLSMGEVIMGNHFLNKKMNTERTLTPEEFIQKNIPDNSDVLLLIHGMWGNIIFAWNDMLNKLHPLLDDVIIKHNTTILSLIWDCTPMYNKNVEIAKWKGRLFSPILQALDTLSLHKIDVLSHSMGNRIFQQILLNSVNQININTWIMMAADLAPDVFDTSLLPYVNQIKELDLFIHKQDRTLQISEFLNKKKRIGIEGPSTIYSQMNVIDVTDIKDNEDGATNYINHRYFYTSPTVRKKIKYILLEE